MLNTKRCIPCEGGTPPLEGAELEKLKQQLNEEAVGWEIIDNKKIHQKFSFPDFATALEFVNKIGDIAEHENHHPDIMFSWGYVEVTIWTHKIGGLSEADFVLAAKISNLRPSS